MVGENEMKIVAKLYYFNSESSIKNKFVDFEADINFGVLHKRKYIQTLLYPSQFYCIREKIIYAQLHHILHDLNIQFLTRTNQNVILNYLKEKCL